MTHENGEGSAFNNILRIGVSLILLFFAAIFFIAGTKLILFDVAPSANCSGSADANRHLRIAELCANEQWLRRFTIGSGYTMESIALLLGMAFVAVNVRACLKLNHGRLPRELQATPDSISAPRGVHLEPREGTAETQQSELTCASTANSVVNGPPDYETACREPQTPPNDDSMVYKPPSTDPPPLETPTSSNAPSWRQP